MALETLAQPQMCGSVTMPDYGAPQLPKSQFCHLRLEERGWDVGASAVPGACRF